MLVIGLSGPLAGQIFDRLGARAAYCGGLVVLGASFFAAGHVTALWQYYVTVGLFAGLGVSTLGMVSANALLSRWFHARLGTAIGIVYSAMGFGVLLGAPVAQVLITEFGWRDAYRLFGMAMLGLSVIVAVLPLTRLWRGSSDWQARRTAREAAAPAWNVASAARTSAFWALAAVYFFTSVASFSVMPQSVACMVEAGISPLTAAGAFGMAGMLSLVGNVAVGMLADRYGRRVMVTISYIGTMIGITCLLAVTASAYLWLVYAWVLFFGINQGTRGPIISTIVALLYAGGGVGRIYGTITLGMGIGAAFGSWISGYLHEVNGTYTASFLLAIGAAACGLLTFWVVPSLADRRTSAGLARGGAGTAA
jgi:MFS family permease